MHHDDDDCRHHWYQPSLPIHSGGGWSRRSTVVVLGLLVPATMCILWILLSIGICFHGQLPRSYVYYVSILPYFHCHDDIPYQ